MCDSRYGGYFHSVNRDGSLKASCKYVCGRAFVLCSLAAYYRPTGDSETKRLARECLEFLETHAHDDPYRKHFPCADRTGAVVSKQSCENNQHASGHLLETLVGLYRVPPDLPKRRELRRRLDSLASNVVGQTGRRGGSEYQGA